MADLSMRVLLSCQDSASGTIRQMASNFGPVGGALAAIGGVAIGVGVASVQMASNFETGITSLVTGAGEAQSNLGMVSQGILQMSVDVGTSTDQLVKGMYMIESAGYHGADGLNVLKIAAEGAKVGNADLGVVGNALTTILTDYHLKATDAAGAMNALITTVASGKMHMQDLASAMGSVLPLASSLGVSFPQVAGAMATMTNSGMSAQRAAQNLANTIRSLAAPNSAATKSMKEVGMSAQQLKDTLSNQGLAAAIQMVEDHVGKKFPAGSVQAVQAFKAIMGGATGYNVALMLGGKNMTTYESNIKAIGGAMQNSKNGVMGWEQVQSTFNQKIAQAQAAFNVLLITLGTKLLPIMGQIVGAISPVIGAFSNWISSSDNLNKALPIIIPVLAGLAAVLIAAVVPSLWATATALWAAIVPALIAAAPFIAIGLAVAGLVAALMWAYNSFAPFRAFLASIGQLCQMVFGQIVSALKSAFMPVWQQLVQMFQSQIVPLWNQVVAGFQAALPVLKIIGMVIGGVLAVAFAIFVGLLTGLIKGIAGFLSGIVTFFSGIIMMIRGSLTILGGVFSFFIDLFTGHFDRLGADLGTMWHGVIMMFQGAWTAIQGIFQAGIGALMGLVTGFAQGFGGAIQGILQNFGLLSSGADAKMKLMQTQTQMHTEQMRVQTATTTQAMALKNIANMEHQRQGILAQIAQTTDPAKRHMLEMAAQSIAAAEAQERGVVQHAAQMKAQSLKHLAELQQKAVQEQKRIADESRPWWEKLGSGIQGIVGNIGAWLGTTWKNIVNTVGGWFSWLGGQSQHIWNAIVTWIMGIVNQAGSWLGQTWNNIVNTVVGWFSWLYNHNYYFKALVDEIVKQFNITKAFIINVWNAICTWLGNAWNTIKTTATNVFNAIASFFTDIWNAIKGAAVAAWNWIMGIVTTVNKAIQGFLLTVWNAVATWFAGVWNTISSKVSQAWGYISGIFGNAWNTYIAGPLGSLWNQLTGWFGNLANQALQWGQNLIQGFINGIMNMAGGVGQAAQNIMGTVASFLGFHSPAKQGPGADLMTWGPGLVKGFSDGMLAAKPILQSSLNLLMAPVVQTMTAPAASTPPISGASSAGGGVNIGAIHVHLNSSSGDAKAHGQQVAHEVQKQMAKMLRGQAITPRLTSGGTH